MKNIVNIATKFINKSEAQYTLRLSAIEFSPSHGHEICVMQLAGKNAFPKFTPQEILSNPKAMVGLSPSDAAKIAKLDCIIQERINKFRVLEVSANGTILLRDSSGRMKRYAEKEISSSKAMIAKLDSLDAHDLGYRVGFRDGYTAKITIQEKLTTLPRKILDKIKSYL